MECFADRAHAGRVLAPLVAERLNPDDPPPLVLALPRGGVPVAYEVARELGAPLDVLLVRKLGVPGHEELAFGALASGGVQVRNPHVVEAAGLRAGEMDAVAVREGLELARRELAYRGDREPLDVAGRTAIVVDDGLATGATMRAAVRALRDRGAARIVVAVPVGSRQACESLVEDADDVVCVHVPRFFRAVGAWYADFAPVPDAAVPELLRTAGAP